MPNSSQIAARAAHYRTLAVRSHRLRGWLEYDGRGAQRRTPIGKALTWPLIT